MTTKRRLKTALEVARAARGIQQRGVEYLCVSLGREGAVLMNADNSWHCPAPRVHKQSTVGCGDALVAGLLAALRKGESPQGMLRFGVICGSATASQPGTELFAIDDLEAEFPELEVSSLDI